MSELKDESIKQGVRKKTEYEDSRRARLALTIKRKDGGELSIPIAADMRSHREEKEIQQNTLLAIMPLVRLPGHDKLGERPRPAVPRRGCIYVFQDSKLWREALCDGKGGLAEVDIAHWRKQAEQKKPADERPAVGVEQSILLTPILIQGRAVGDRYQMAYSEMPWTWEFITWLEEDPNRVNAVSQMVSVAWAAAVVGGERWYPTQAMPSIVIDSHSDGLRPRDYGIETLLADPSKFKPNLASYPAGELISEHQQVLVELAGYEKSKAPEALPELVAGSDVLSEKSLRGYPQLVGLMLDDPLFNLRHAAAQIRLAEGQLLALNALVGHKPNGRYAQVLQGTVMQPGKNPLADLQDCVNLEQFKLAILDKERRRARDHFRLMQQRIIDLFGSASSLSLPQWHLSRDERLLEPYALLTEVLDCLSKSPGQIDSLSTEESGKEALAAAASLCTRLLEGTHPFSSYFLGGKPDTVPDAVQRLQTLAATQRAPQPEHLGLSSLLQGISIDPADTDRVLAYKNVHALIGDFMDTFSASVVTCIGRLKQSGVLRQVEFKRLFVPSVGVLNKLSPTWKNIRIMTESEAGAQNLRILGVNGGGLSNGLTAAERMQLRQENFLYGTITDHEGKVVASSSPRHAPRPSSNLGRTMFLVAPANDPQVQKFSAWKSTVNRKVESVSATGAVPIVAVACAMYNLQAQVEGMAGLLAEPGDGSSRYYIGAGSAVADLAVAMGNLAIPLFGDVGLVKMLNKPRFDVARVSTRWAMNLSQQTGSPKLPILRAASASAMLLTTLVTAWDAGRAWRQGDTDAALAYGVAAVGGAVWTAYAAGLILNPYALVAGAILFIGGSIVAGWLTDSDAEVLIKHGPFGSEQGEVGILDSVLGNDARFAHLSNPQYAYVELIGLLGKPVITVTRYADWLRNAPAPDRMRVQAINVSRRASAPVGGLSCQRASVEAFVEEDWVVTVYSPLLAMFKAQHEFRLFATEQFGVLPFSGAFNVERVETKVVNEPKLAAYPLNSSTVLYVLPKQFPQVTLTPLQRHSGKVTQRLKVIGQFQLGSKELPDERLVLPQPSPKTWTPYAPAYSRPPELKVQPGDAPYWQIEITEFKA
ncbi:hypothetical protein ACYCAX_07690 [Pseudomonas sp. MT3]